MICRDAGQREHERERVGGAGGRGDRAGDAGGGPVLDDARHVGDERRDRDGGRGRGHGRHRDPDGDHLVHAGDGDADDHGRQGRRPDRPQAGVRDRLRDLRGGLVHDRDRAVVAGAAGRVVSAGGRRCGADPAGDRRAGGGQLSPGGPAARLWPGDGGRGDRGRRRAADRGAVHDLSQLALGVRRRGADRARHPRADAADRGRAPRAATPDRPRRRRAVGGRAGAGGVRRAALERVGLGRAEARRTGAVRDLGDAVADPRAGCSWSGCSSSGSRGSKGAARSRSCARRCSGTCRRAAA